MAEGAVPRTPVIAGNWKMHTTLAEARALAAAVRDGCRGPRGDPRRRVPALHGAGRGGRGAGRLAPSSSAPRTRTGRRPAPSPGRCRRRRSGTRAPALVILGHSERRHGLGETDEVVRRKVTAALAQGLTPLVCVGETAAERAAGRTLAVVTAPARRRARRAVGRGGRALLARLRARVGHRDGADGDAGPGRRGPRPAARGARAAGGPGRRGRVPHPLRRQRQARGDARRS